MTLGAEIKRLRDAGLSLREHSVATPASEWGAAVVVPTNGTRPAVARPFKSLSNDQCHVNSPRQQVSVGWASIQSKRLTAVGL